MHSDKPNRNDFCDPFNGRMRDECLKESQFSTRVEVQMITENWRHIYDSERMHSIFH
ncbi:integrase core domain-containing protein [Sneathiella aquimaris]|uniref:integrase core domain-containing protein n=1 Tax=Sneathiella aquimaris TaxID=2599305 RepID=UPI00146BCBE3